MRGRLVALALLAIVAWSDGTTAGTIDEPSARESVEGVRWIMGTALRVVLGASGPEADGLLEECFEIAERWDHLLSDYDSSSPLSRLNARAGSETTVPAALFDYLLRARWDVARTEGAYDPTVGALVARLRAGDGSDLETALASVGMARVQLREENGKQLARLDVGTRLDPGADGKGVALDRIVTFLRDRGISNAFADFGGSSMAALGTGPDGNGWLIELRAPDGEFHALVRLRDRALAVSSTMRRDAETGETVGVHLVDPRSGGSVTLPRTAVVIAPSATDADVLATALAVEGSDGLRWLPAFDEASALLLEEGNVSHTAGGFERWIDPHHRR